MKHILTTAIIVFSSLLPGHAQKVKYKDLYVLLRAENYRDADVFLRRLLVAEPDHPHANYSMGRMLQTYMLAADPLKQRQRIYELADSASLYYMRAMGLLNEKYVKKHDDDYYAEFRRRDLRTGKFQVKVSDIRLDIEARLKAVDDFKLKVKNLDWHFQQAISFYDSCQSLYRGYTTRYPDYKQLYFATTDTDLQNFRVLAGVYDSALYHLNTYRELFKQISQKSSQALKIKEIDNYPIDGLTKTDYTAEELAIWDYGSWGNHIHDLIAKKIYPLKSRMLAFDKRLMDLHNKVIQDSLDARSETFKLATENVARDLTEFGNLTLPAAIFNYRIAEINYHSAVNHMYTTVLDTADIGVKFDALKDLRAQLSGISRLVELLKEADNETQRQIFRDFIKSRYQDEAGLENFIREQVEFVAFDSTQLENWYELINQQDQVAVWQDDTIPLVPGKQLINHDSVRYTTVFIDSIAERTLGFYSWQEKIDSLSLLFGVSPSSRVIDSLFMVSIDPQVVVTRTSKLTFLTDTISNRQRVWALTATNNSGRSNYILQTFVTNPQKGLGWNKIFQLKKQPVAIRFDASNKHILYVDDKDKPILVLDEHGEEQHK